jgi:hypothetical protein
VAEKRAALGYRVGQTDVPLPNIRDGRVPARMLEQEATQGFLP